MEIAPFDKADIEQLTALQEDDWADMKLAFTDYLHLSFCYPIKVQIDGRVVGIGATIVHQDVGWLGHIVVDSAFRGKGLGKRITEHLVDIGGTHNCKTIYLLATDMGAPVYEKVGFITETEYLLFKDIKLKSEFDESAHIHPYREDFKRQIARLDRTTSGEDRMFYIERFLANGFVYLKDKVVEGYYLPDLGEGLLVAQTASAGLELTKLHLKSHNRLMFPKNNLAVLDFLYRNGNKETENCRRMRLGKERPVKMENIYNRIAGNVG